MKCFCNEKIHGGLFPFGAKNGMFKRHEKNKEKAKLIPNYCMKH